ncbi:MAG: lamin tail domain-containing protein [Thermoanaerobaculales bacterium]|jgi:hypothetical protein|nr:lamin tail domain-containing protein [Thermoanaerobaculales bacterium]
MVARATVVIAIGLSVAAVPSAAQDPASREPRLIITEVMPNPSPGDCPWIELFNSGDVPVPLKGLVLRTAQDPVFVETRDRSPGPPDDLPGGAHLVVFLKPVEPPPAGARGYSSDGSHCKARPGVTVLDGRPDLFDADSSTSGEISLYRETSTGAMILDYVAWGAPGETWSAKSRGSRWPQAGFVRLDSSFGVAPLHPQIARDWSIGCYPGATCDRPEDWALYDPVEIAASGSKGGANPVPRPKVFSLANGAVVGSHSVAVGWVGHEFDDSYRFELATDDGFTAPDVVVNETVTSPTIRISGALESGAHYYRVTAISDNLPSLPSVTALVEVIPSACDWPVLPAPLTRQALEDWANEPTCPQDLECEIIAAIRFKYQRKDTPLACCECRTRKGSVAAKCRFNGVHPYCHTNVFNASAPAILLCAEGNYSPTCASSPARTLCESGAPTPPVDMTDRRATEEDFPGIDEYETYCPHGSQNCVRASVSMMVSAYNGACLSQDVIAYGHFVSLEGTEIFIPKAGDLGHGMSVDCSDRWGAQCTVILRRALGIRPQETDKEIFIYRWVVPSFSEIREWLDRGRPIMTEAETQGSTHMRVLAGYCVSNDAVDGQPPVEWVYIYDPKSGPRAETYKSWASSAVGTWVAPPNKPGLLSTSSWSMNRVLQDPPEVWCDLDGNALMDYDDSERSPRPTDCHP